jgi:phosphoribosylamine--glycine ligase
VQQSVIQPVLDTMRSDGHPYSGVLYAGLVLTDSGPTVIEFNCRFGDPEIQAVLPRLQSDLMGILEAAVAGTLDTVTLEWSEESVVNVVLAAQGYPSEPRSGDVITGLDASTGLVFHAGTKRDGKHLRTDGGRVLSVLGTGSNTESARHAAYAAVESIRFKGKMFRRDIAAQTVDVSD